MDQHIQNIKLDGLFDMGPISGLAQENNGQSGLCSYAQGRYLEEKSQLEESYQKYYQGFYLYADPLCAYRLGEIFSNEDSARRFQQQKDKWKSYNFLVSSLTVELYYRGIELNSRMIVQSILEEEKQESIEQNGEWQNAGITHDFAQYACNLISYKQLIESYGSKPKHAITLYQLLLLIVTRLDTQDKLLEQVVGYINHRSHLTALNEVAQQLMHTVHCLARFRQDSAMFEKVRETLFELVFVTKDIMEIKINPLKFEKVPDYLRISQVCGTLWSHIMGAIHCLLEAVGVIRKSIHQSIVLRLSAKVMRNGNPYQNAKPQIHEALEVQRRELKLQKASQYHYAIAHYKIGKMESRLDKDNHTSLRKAYELFTRRLELEDTDKFQLILIYYYLSKLSSLFNKIADEEKYLSSALSLITAGGTLQMVRTLQYHVIKKKILLYQPLFEARKQLKLNENQKEKQEQIDLLEQQRMMVQKMKQHTHQPDPKKTPIKLRQADLAIQGPLVVNMLATSHLHAETAISQYASSSKKPTQDDLKDSLHRKINQLVEKDGLFFVNPRDVDHIQFVQKGSFGGGFYKVIIQGKKFAMKTITSISTADLDRIMDTYKQITNFSHPHLRRTLAFMIEQLNEKTLNFSLIYEYAQRNLYSITGSDSDRLQVALDIVGAVRYLHEKDAIHGNIKPSNVLISSMQNQAYGYVCDWELVSKLYPIIGKEKSNYWMSGSQYHAPEVKGERRNLSKWSDTWSLGLVLLLVFFDVDLKQVGRFQLHLDEGLNISLGDMKKESTAQREEVLEIVKKMLESEPSRRMGLAEVETRLQQLQAK